MLKIRPLNRETTLDEDGPTIRREAQEEITLDMYNKALRLQSCGELLAAEDILQTLIEENIPQLESQGGLPKTMSTIKYSCYVNLGSVAMKRNDPTTALKNYLVASELDKTDVTLWYKIGNLALKLDKFYQASYAFAKGLECSESHWPCLDQIVSVTFALKDTITCLKYIGKALMLDADYTKGLVLRKNIYDCNPAAKEYYQLYNPEYIYEPSLDIPIEREDEDKFLEDAQKLCDRVNEVEKALGPKPLPCIPLPKPLKEYTWLAVGHSLTDLHNYISENKMTHFCMVDLRKCMSDEGEMSELVNQETSSKALDTISKMDLTEQEKIGIDNIECNIEPSQKMETDDIIERRLSQTSENNINEVDSVTPIQTDIDEMEQDVDDVEEVQDQKTAEKNKPQNRGNKRRRDLLSDLQIWGWHSKRKAAKKAKIERDFTIEDALTRIIPSYLRPNGINRSKYIPSEDSMNTMDLYNLHIETEASSLMSPPHSPKNNNNGKYFGSLEEKDDVQKFWTKKWNCCDAVNLIEGYVYALSTLWHLKWPKELVSIYIEAYNMFREHFEHPHLYDIECPFEQFKNDALATLLYGELMSYNKDLHKQDTIHNTSLHFLQLVSAFDDNWSEEHVPYWSRVYWLRAHIYRKDNQNNLAINSLQLIHEVIISEENKNNQKFKLCLPNCFNYKIITIEIIEKLQKNLEMIESLSQLENLYDSQKYTEVAEILKVTFNISNPPTYGRMGRPAQLAMLLHSLWYTDITECFIWTEVCLHESLNHFIKVHKDRDKWEMILDKCLSIIYEIIKTETVSILDSLSEEKRSRLVESISAICCRQVNTENINKLPLGTVKPWILLHYILVREEHRQQAKKIVKHVKKDEEKTNKPEDASNPKSEEKTYEIPPSIAILFSGHEFLGYKSWCLAENGALLHFILDTIIDRLDTPIFESIKEKIDIHLEQTFFCLYQHPSKKNKISRHLADHNVSPLPLTWEKAQQVCEFFCPDALPEFDSYKNISITSELEQLLQRITSLVPSECDPQPLVAKVNEFVNGNSDILPKKVDFPTKTRAMYYLLGDYYFKQSEVKQSYKYFLLDLCINPLRLDAWACLALGMASQLESQLNRCKKFKNETEFLDKAKSAQVCFKQALNLANNHITLWIEYGSFEYTVHSFCSRVLKYESETLSMEKFEILEKKIQTYLESSKASFMRALNLHQPDNEIDERWLHHYMLGKIAEKRQKEPSEYLEHYLTAAALLNENKATYPEKINYNNPQHLAIEALEVHYRINASILKYLELHEGKIIPDVTGKMFKQSLDSSVFPKHGYENRPETNTDKEITVENEKTTENLQNSQISPTGNNTVNVNKNADVVENEKIIIELDTNAGKVEDENKLVSVENIDCSKKYTIMEAIKNESIQEVETQIVNKDDENLPEIEKCVEDMLVEIEKKEVMPTTDIIMIDDSDEDIKLQKEETETKPFIDMKGKNVQEIMDAMMKETMEKTKDVSIDTDSDVTPQEVIIDDTSIKTELETKTNEKEENVIADNGMVKEELEKNIKSERSDDTHIRKSVDDTSSTSSSSSDSDSSDSDSDDSSSSSSSSSSDNNGTLSENEVLSLVDRCITGLEQCIRRLPQNYKALYRLAHLYFHYSKKKDLSKCRQLFLGEYKCKNSVLVSGLFADRKTSNFFNGVWRIPSSEIDRPGSLAAHMGRCVSLLLQVLHDTNDHKTLLDLCLQLRKIPDDDKIYIKHSEREQLSEQALSMCIQCLRKQTKNISNLSSSATQKLLLDVFRIYQRSQKNLTHKEIVFSSMLVDVYKHYMKDKLPENANVLDLATKYCQQNRAAEKLKKQQNQNILPRASSVPSTVPVLPTPTTITAQTNQPLKRPGIGRPRGRPPGPKIPGQTKAPRSRTPVSTSTNMAWSKSSYDAAAYDYLKHYQEELIRQYSQTLSLTQQMNQLSSFLPANSQNSILSPTSLLQTMQQMGTGMNPLLATQLSQSMNQLSPNLLKRISEMYKIPTSLPSTSQLPQGLTAEQMRRLNSLSQSISNSNLSSTSQRNTLVTTQQQTSPTIPHASNVTSFSKTSSTFKYPSAEFSKPKMKEVTKTTSSFSAKEPLAPKALKTNTNQIEVDTATSILKDRPNISITPVMQPMTTAVTPSKHPTTSPKTLQEKLADKQKQHCSKNTPKSIDYGMTSIEKHFPAPTSSKMDFGSSNTEKSSFTAMASNKPLDFGTKTNEKTIFSSNASNKVLDLGNKNTEKPMFPVTSNSPFLGTTLANLSIPSSLNVIPTFAKDTGFSIGQIMAPKPSKPIEIKLPPHRVEPSKSKPNTPVSGLDKMPISLSVIRKPEEKRDRKPSSDDDVIIIE